MNDSYETILFCESKTYCIVQPIPNQMTLKSRFFLVNQKQTAQPVQSYSWTNESYKPVLFMNQNLTDWQMWFDSCTKDS